MRAAYADPPYIGQAARHYNSEEVDHVALLERLAGEYEAWALSASAPSLSVLIPLLPPGTRTGIWVKPFASWKPNVYPSYAWEPVIFFGGAQAKAATCSPRLGVCQHYTPEGLVWREAQGVLLVGIRYAWPRT